MSKILEIAKEVLEIEGNELIRQANMLGINFENAVNLINECKGKVIVTGVGKSGHIGAKIA
ncbi:MAG: KpsF/GutQ family sugar-phosphate isomerase, partial [Campylobacter sp.]|nr:KpsF/GutQ family sugar-phosphate isomerase [Campylobacter sp.]